jgi:hypothetical protein
VVRLWQHLLGRTDLADQDGQAVEVTYPGRANDGRGADFKDAVVSSRRGRRKGHIEVHVSAGGWKAHGHHRDPVYNEVVLHVVFRRDRDGETVLQNGDSVPTVILNEIIERSPSSGVLVPTSVPRPICLNVAARLGREAVADFLERAGDERFEDKAGRFRDELLQTDASQCLYRGIMEALGYAKNKKPFSELAARVPLSFLQSLAEGSASQEDYIIRQQALLLGTAGLLPSQRPEKPGRPGRDEMADRLEHEWAGGRPGVPMSFRRWDLFKVRPFNSPLRRLAGMMALLDRYRQAGIFAGLAREVRKAPSLKSGALESALVVEGSGYWSQHFDFGSNCGASGPLVGKGRAREILINVVLPLMLAWCRLEGRSRAGNKIKALYLHFPHTARNSIEQHMEQQLGLTPGTVNSARRQQGLIHIYKSRCTQGKCGDCQLGRGA